MRLRVRRRQREARLGLVILALALAGMVFLTVQDPPAIAAQAPATAAPQAEQQPVDEGRIVGEARLIDADTLDIDGTRIRLHGIDAPEADQRCTGRDGARVDAGAQSRAALSRLIAGREVSCTATDTDRYGRTVATCTVAEIDLNATLVREGWAFAYRRYSEAYVGDEAHARNASAGLWALSCEKPWDYRRRT
jgi:endonuclease YncB( thermonuclease family)